MHLSSRIAFHSEIFVPLNLGGFVKVTASLNFFSMSHVLSQILGNVYSFVTLLLLDSVK